MLAFILSLIINASVQERLAFHRQQLKQRLGLEAQGKVFSTGMEQLFDDSDLIIPGPGGGRGEGQQKRKNVCMDNDTYVNAFLYSTVRL